MPGSHERGPSDTSALTSGALGRELFFRPNRYTAADLAPLHISVRARGNEGWIALGFRNVSQSGVGVAWPGDRGHPSVGDRIEQLELLVDGHPAISAPAKVCSAQADRQLGIEFVGALVAVDALEAARDAAVWASAQGEGAFPEGAWAGVGEDVFKGRVAELALYLRDAKALCARYEQELGWDVVHAPLGSLPYRSVVRFIAETLSPTIVRHVCAIDAAWRSCDGANDAALQAYARRWLHEDVMCAPIMRRALEQPLGYPGDYEVMRYMYERQFEGATLYGKALAHAFVHTPAARAVRARKDMVRGELERLLQRNAGRQEPVRLLSVAAGPAQEVYELLRFSEDLPVNVDIVLFDQEVGALAFAYGRLRGLVEQRWRGRVNVTYLHEGVRVLLKNPEVFAGLGMFDGVICCGLYDYLPEPVAISLTAKLFSVVSPEGYAWIGNMCGHNPSRWIMEHHLNWRLTYRTHEEMLRFAHAGAPDATIDLLEEETTVNPFVRLLRG